MKNRYLSLLFVGVYTMCFPAIASAQSGSPISFPSCVAPDGSIIASYADGVHGIPGSSLVHRGSDTVYLQGAGNVLQCFCPTDGLTGIQTNWLNAQSLSASEIADLIPQDWMYIVSGLPWGLSDHPYMAKNISYTCKAVGGGGDGSGGSGGGSGGGEVDGSVLRTIKKALMKTPARDADPEILGDEIVMLPAAGGSVFHMIIALFFPSL